MSGLQSQMKMQVILPLIMAVAALILLACSGQVNQPDEPVPTENPAASAIISATTEKATESVAEADATSTSVPDEAISAPVSSVSFANDVRPILQSRCLICHGGQRTEKGLNISTYDHLLAGSEKGPVLVPGDATNSKLIQLIEQGKMPKRGPKVTPDQLAVLIEWVNAGALNN